MRLSNKIIFFTVSFLFWQLGLGWGLTGHRVVAQVAQDHLSEETREWLLTFGIKDFGLLGKLLSRLWHRIIGRTR